MYVYVCGAHTAYDSQHPHLPPRGRLLAYLRPVLCTYLPFPGTITAENSVATSVLDCVAPPLGAYCVWGV